MRTTSLGEGGPVVSAIGLGLAALGRPGYITVGHGADLGRDRSVEAMESHAHWVLDAAHGHGVRYFDAARSYGRAEAFLSSWLAARGIQPRAVTIGSKWGYAYTAGWQVDAEVHEVKEHSVEQLQRQARETGELLERHLDLYQIHSATLETGVLEDIHVLEALAVMRSEGTRIGLSVTGTGQAETIRRAISTTHRGERLFDTVQATWNLLEPSAGDALAAAHAAGMGVIVKEALANGRLAGRNGAAIDASLRRGLREEAARLDATEDALAIAAVLAQPWADVVLSGAATAEQLTSNLRALQIPWDERAAERLATMAQAPEDYWAARARLPWN